MTDEGLDISIIIPAFNEERRIGETLRNYCRYFQGKSYKFEVLVIINGCTDQTGLVVEQVRVDFPFIRVKVYPERLGKGGAIIEGFKYAQGNLILHADADGSTPAEEIMNLAEHIGDADAIIGSRWIKGAVIEKLQPWDRRLASRVYNLLVRLVLGLPFMDTQCGAKVFKREMVHSIIFALNTVDYAFDACLLYEAVKRGFRIKEHPVRWTNRKESKVHLFYHSPAMLYSIVLARVNDLLGNRGSQQEGRFDTWGASPQDIFFSIIVPCRTVDRQTEECLRECLRQSYKNFEVILLADEAAVLPEEFARVRIIPTGPVKPSEKRNIGVARASAGTGMVAFLDADAYPEPSWLENSLPYLGNPGIGAVGGPNLTPPGDSLRQKASGDILSMPVCVGRFAIRYQARYDFRKRQSVQELPSCNLMVRKELFESIGGFDTTLLTAEDSRLCFDIRRTGKRILYAPDVKVYHHRRRLFVPHMKQIWIYGRDKMWLIKSDFSPDKLYYFIPMVFVLAVAAGGAMAAVHADFRKVFLVFVLGYLGIVLCAGLLKSPRRIAWLIPGIIITHLSYALGSLCGLVTQRR